MLYSHNCFYEDYISKFCFLYNKLRAGVSCTIFHSAFPSQIPSLSPLVPPCSNVSGHSVTPSPPVTPVTLRHSPSFSVTPRHAPSLPFIFRHFALFSVFTSFSVILYHFPSSLYVPSSGYDPYPYQLSPPIILGLVALIIF